MKEKAKFILKAIAVALLLTIAYLFALNGRYVEVGGREGYNVIVFDKWKKNVFVVCKDWEEI
ncbi:MAG: hypothetical protein PHF92_06980 [Bacteroidales bacterium]|nr:hypothetical protein [Bacteroidales bacterium]